MQENTQIIKIGNNTRAEEPITTYDFLKKDSGGQMPKCAGKITFPPLLIYPTLSYSTLYYLTTTFTHTPNL